jgi:hypothetical protein
LSTEPTLSQQLRQQVRGNLKSPAFIRQMEALMMQAAYCLDELEKQLAEANRTIDDCCIKGAELERRLAAIDALNELKKAVMKS